MHVTMGLAHPPSSSRRALVAFSEPHQLSPYSSSTNSESARAAPRTDLSATA